MGTMRRSHLQRAIIVIVSGVLLALGMTGCNEDSAEKTLGNMSVASVAAAYDVDNDPLMNQWIDRVGQTMVSHCRRQNLPYDFTIIDTGMVNAFAAPYGHIYVTRGLLEFADTEDEIWMVMGHEIGHIVNRDSIKSFKRSMIWGILDSILTSKAQTVGDLTGIGLALLSLRYSRIDEYEADDSGVALSYLAGYDPHAGLMFFDKLMNKLEDGRPSSWEVFFMTHPPTERRIARQLKSADLSESPAALSQIGRGYIRRACPAKGSEFLARAVASDEKDVDLRTALGDAYSAHGSFAQARAQYQAALDLQAGNSYAQARLAALSGAKPWSPPGLGDFGRERAGELLANMEGVKTATGSMRASEVTYGQAMNANLQALRGQAKGISGRILKLNEENTDLTEGLQKLAARGAASISRSIECVYVLDAVNEDFKVLNTELDELLPACNERLAAAQRGEGDPAELRALQSAITEMKRAAGSSELAMSEAPQTAAMVRQAQSAAAGTTSLLEQLVRTKHGRDRVADNLRAQATHTQEQAMEALQQVRRAKRQSTKARGHALVARLNLLGAGAGPELEAVMDRQVAHFMMCPTAQVRALRADGAGYGEAAAAIAAGRSLDTRPSNFLGAEGKSVSPIGSAMREGASVANVNVLLKFLAAAMEYERDADLATE